ncbi:hypothetical protein [Streptomyces yaizuensis]|uniref:Lipoprotein n=1 Tax=Streptomyces yaizuensis TaxID=2989713 RepID=A0ABQ5NV69_9ACTN|nr:hypothetical protein [Streptomyces sp. YSPA8]GLF94256.1 lipoprotein [Streptomyces sp. YSPA8]
MRSGVRGRWGALALAGGVLLLSGCGIRTTQVPVNDGPAPSRPPCAVSGAPAAEGFPVRVYLVCASGLKPVDRVVELPAESAHDGRVRVAGALLAELRRQPSETEREAGFTTDVPDPVVVGGARPGDPAGTLRLSRQPEDLPPTALAQIVCTFAESQAAVAGGAVVLGGPGEYPPRGYSCQERVRERPAEPVPTLSPLPSPEPEPSAPSAPQLSGSVLR